ncbi:universal stress protein [Actibacterium sp. MT2.3-13A]|uniref:universal stress protein n=1 Tax=Actibacterium sp. MT2.3-13A TaxID=2828332 RepID=UPI001BA62D27|nr:universal stress protein [Actibacterium sp. MT2.3-13A]
MLQHLLVATDLSPRADRSVARAFDLAGRLGARLTLLTVIDEALPGDLARQMQGGAEARLDQFAASHRGAQDVRYEARAVIGDPVGAISAMAATEQVDLLVLGIHRPRPFLDILRETTMERIVRLQDCPVLLVTDPVDHPYSTVLAAVDFAPASTHALSLAAELAPEAALHGVHAVHVPYKGYSPAAGVVGTAAPFLREARDSYNLWRDQTTLPERLGEVEFIEGAAVSVVTTRAANLGCDLLCLGAHGRVGSAPAFLGSLANDLIRTPPCDLLIAR